MVNNLGAYSFFLDTSIINAIVDTPGLEEFLRGKSERGEIELLKPPRRPGPSMREIEIAKKRANETTGPGV